MQLADLLHYHPLLGALSFSAGLTVMPAQVLGTDYLARSSYVLCTPCPFVQQATEVALRLLVLGTELVARQACIRLVIP